VLRLLLLRALLSLDLDLCLARTGFSSLGLGQPLRAPRPPLSESSATADAAAFRSDFSATADDAAFRSDFSATADAAAFRSDFSATADAAAFRSDFSATADSAAFRRDFSAPANDAGDDLLERSCTRDSRSACEEVRGLFEECEEVRGDLLRDLDLRLLAPLCSALVCSLLGDLDRRLLASLCSALLSGVLPRRSGILCSCDLSRCRSLPRLSESSLFLLRRACLWHLLSSPRNPDAPSPRREDAPSPRREEGVRTGIEPELRKVI